MLAIFPKKCLNSPVPRPSALKTADFHYDLPHSQIAQHPASDRDGGRLLVVNREERSYSHHQFLEFGNFLQAGDVLVLNDSRVIPARLRGLKVGGSAAVELLLTEPAANSTWWAMLRPGKRFPVGTRILISDRDGSETEMTAEVLEKNNEGHRRLRFEGTENMLAALERIGEMPLPPYIRREAHGQSAEDFARYQTVYAEPAGSIAAPTAGLHFTESMLAQLTDAGVEVYRVTLHVGLGTFAPVKADDVAKHEMHTEKYSVPQSTADAVNTAKSEGRRVIAVGTTTVRVLESCGLPMKSIQDKTDIFIYPPREFAVADGMVTNFHLPESTLLMLVSAFATPGELSGREWMLEIYAEAVRENYRFFSFGDAMFIT